MGEPADSDAGEKEGVPVAVAGTGDNSGGRRSEHLTPPTKRTKKDVGGRRQVVAGYCQDGGDTVSSVTARPWPDTKGHTGYLTFARKVV